MQPPQPQVTGLETKLGALFRTSGCRPRKIQRVLADYQFTSVPRASISQRRYCINCSHPIEPRPEKERDLGLRHYDGWYICLGCYAYRRNDPPRAAKIVAFGGQEYDLPEIQAHLVSLEKPKYEEKA